ncbi:MAG: hypothetical protein IH624_03770 [Phycisphaerae bacterium]|nr:hypothetical protein [Phycisphaerae bacterium]
MLARRLFTRAIVIAILTCPLLPDAAYGTPPTQAPWVYIDENMYQTELPRVEDLQTPATRREQREVVEGAVRLVDNTAQGVRGTVGVAAGSAAPPRPGNIAAAAGAVLTGAVEAVAGAFRAIFNTIF